MENNEAEYEKLKNCIVCKKEMFSIFIKTDSALSPTQPSGGISFSGSGEYGSSYDYNPDYDGVNTYVVNICDECLTLAIQEKEVLLYSKETTIKHHYKDA